MRLKHLTIDNFGSYKQLSFNFENLGLCLLYGPTGSGKSTLQDAVCWMLYGKTPKGGTVQEINNWYNKNTATKGELSLALKDELITIVRVRGTAHENDLYWMDRESTGKKRGKDLKETQQLLEAKLCISYDLYLAASYHSEYSNTAAFYVSTKAQQKELLEKIVDMSLPITLEERLKAELNHNKKLLEKHIFDTNKLNGKLEQLRESYKSTEKSLNKFEDEKTKNSEEAKTYNETLLAKASEDQQDFELQRSDQLNRLNIRLGELVEKIRNHNYEECPTCFQDLPSKEIEIIESHCEFIEDDISKTKNLINPHDKLVKKFTLALDSIECNKESTNPFIETLDKQEQQIIDMSQVIDERRHEKLYYDQRKEQLKDLTNICKTLRAELLKRSINELQHTINTSLETYFDAEFKLTITVDEDGIDLTINKNGYDCTYNQLSKGQRGILKLCFSIAFMRQAQMNAGYSPNLILLDEPLDGLDSNFKIKAYGLFDELATKHESVIVIDHTVEFQSLFTQQFEVSISNGYSTVKKI